MTLLDVDRIHDEMKRLEKPEIDAQKVPCHDSKDADEAMTPTPAHAEHFVFCFANRTS
jgi:hypothetical protein